VCSTCLTCTGTIIGNITELARKANAETNIADQVQNEARAMCRGRADTFLTNRIMQHFQYNLERSPATDVLSFLRCLPGELEMEFAAQCGWIPRRLHGMAQNGMLFKVPFFNPLDNRSKICLCSKMKVCIVQEYVKDSVAAVVSADARPITVEGQPSSDFYVILSGKVAVEQTHRRIGTLEQGHFFGEYNILLPQRLGSFGQLQSRTTYAVNGDCELCALGYEDFQELRRERPAINEAVLPYIEESMGHEMHSNRWFYVEMKSASGLRASDASTLEADGLSDPYCVMFLDNHIVGKTPVHFKTLDPVWVTTVALAHSAMEELLVKHGDVNLRFEIYDFDGAGDPDFLGGTETTLSKLSGLRDFRQFGPNAEDVVTELPLYDTSGLASPDPGEDAENLGSVTVVLTNYDWTQHVHSQLNAPAVLADVNRRRKLQSQRHIHLTHEAAALHRLQSDVDGLVTNMTAMDAKMATMDAKMDTIMSLLQSR
jgi:CRP-like cAMP-binding protein